MIAGLEIVADKASKQSFDPERKAALTVAAKALEQGLIVRGLPGDTVGICPPLIIDEMQINDLFDRLGRALDAAQAHLRSE